MTNTTIFADEDGGNRQGWLAYLRTRRAVEIRRYAKTGYRSVRHQARLNALRYSAMIRGAV